MSRKTLGVRLTEQQMDDLVRVVMNRACAPSAWGEKVREALESKPGVNMKILRQFMNEAERISAPLQEVQWLRDYMEQVTTWTEEANKYLIRKHRRRDSKEHASKVLNGTRFRHIGDLIDQAQRMAFDAPELKLLQETYHTLVDYKQRLASALQNETNMDKCRALYERGLDLGADMEEMQILETRLRRYDWEREAPQAIMPRSKATYEDVVRLVEEARALGIDPQEDTLQTLVRKEAHGREWMARAQRVLEQPASAQEIQSVVMDAVECPKMDALYASVVALATRVQDVTREVERLRGVTTATPIDDRPTETDLHRALKAAQALSFPMAGVDDLRAEAQRMEEWSQEALKLFAPVRNSQTKTPSFYLNEVEENVETITTAALTHARDVYCVCRTAESGFMIECDVCHEWFHGPCVKLARRDAKLQSSYTCPICDPHKPIPHITKRAKLEDIQAVLHEGALRLRIIPKTYRMIQTLAERGAAYRQHVQSFCRSKTQLGVEDLPRIKACLTELEGLEILLQDEREFLRTKVQMLTGTQPPADIPPHHHANSHPLHNHHHHHHHNQHKSNGHQHNDHVSHSPQAVLSPPPPPPPSSQQQQQQQYLCSCRRQVHPDDPTMQMIGCDYCHHWFHIACVSLTPSDIAAIEQYMCPSCVKKSQAQPPQPPRPQIIKLRVKPPSQDLKRKHPLAPKPEVDDAGQKKPRFYPFTSGHHQATTS